MREETCRISGIKEYSEKISGKIIEEEMQRMNYEVDAGRTAKEVARGRSKKKMENPSRKNILKWMERKSMKILL